MLLVYRSLNEEVDMFSVPIAKKSIFQLIGTNAYCANFNLVSDLIIELSLRLIVDYGVLGCLCYSYKLSIYLTFC